MTGIAPNPGKDPSIVTFVVKIVKIEIMIDGLLNGNSRVGSIIIQGFIAPSTVTGITGGGITVFPFPSERIGIGPRMIPSIPTITIIAIAVYIGVFPTDRMIMRLISLLVIRRM
jgi:hypothetical protein